MGAAQVLLAMAGRAERKLLAVPLRLPPGALRFPLQAVRFRAVPVEPAPTKAVAVAEVVFLAAAAVTATLKQTGQVAVGPPSLGTPV